MKNYIIAVDGRHIEIPNVYDEVFSTNMVDPSMTVDGSLRYDTSYGESLIAELKTRPNITSNRKYWELQGYLKGRGNRSELIYLDRLQGTIQGYIRISSVVTNFQGGINNKREMSIKITER